MTFFLNPAGKFISKGSGCTSSKPSNPWPSAACATASYNLAMQFEEALVNFIEHFVILLPTIIFISLNDLCKERHKL